MNKSNDVLSQFILNKLVVYKFIRSIDLIIVTGEPNCAALRWTK